VDFVADLNPTKQLRFLLNGDYRTLAVTNNLTESLYGVNLVVRYQVSDPFAIAVRGEYVHDDKGLILGTPSAAMPDKTDMEDGTLSLNYSVGSHLAFMFDARYDTGSWANAPGGYQGFFQKNANDATNGQFTATLGVIASTK
jgi:hypothetical protein